MYTTHYLALQHLIILIFFNTFTTIICRVPSAEGAINKYAKKCNFECGLGWVHAFNSKDNFYHNCLKNISQIFEKRWYDIEKFAIIYRCFFLVWNVISWIFLHFFRILEHTVLSNNTKMILHLQLYMKLYLLYQAKKMWLLYRWLLLHFSKTIKVLLKNYYICIEISGR